MNDITQNASYQKLQQRISAAEGKLNGPEPLSDYARSETQRVLDESRETLATLVKELGSQPGNVTGKINDFETRFTLHEKLVLKQGEQIEELTQKLNFVSQMASGLVQQVADLLDASGINDDGDLIENNDNRELAPEEDPFEEGEETFNID